MLSAQQNDLITQTGPGTPCGELMRRYWQPVALAEELLDGEPLSVRLLSEDLVLFRNVDRTLGLVARRCPHRGADLSFGRVEDGGIRCIYHGWVFGADGQCLEQPTEPPERCFKDRIKQVAYPCREAGGLILAYLGLGEPPPLPGLPFLEQPDDERVWSTKLLHECNYLQANEGNVDPQHLSFLHRFVTDESAASPNLNRLLTADVTPDLLVREKPFGLEVVAVRDLSDGVRYARISNFIMPNSSSFDGVPIVNPQAEDQRDNLGYQIHWHVPIDDFSHWKYTVIFRYAGRIDRAYQDAQHANIDDMYQTPGKLENRFLQDRQEMKRKSYAGMGMKYYDHDKFATETQGLICDRGQEHLGVSDKAIIAMRRQMFAAIKDLQEGRTPLGAGTSEALESMVVRVARVPQNVSFDGDWWSGADVAAE